MIVPALLTGLLLVASEAPSPPGPAPELATPVEDSARLLDDATRGAIATKLHAHRETSGVAVGVVVVKSLAGRPLADVTADTAQAFRAGWAQDAAWVLVVLAVDDRKLRIEGDDRLGAQLTAEHAARLTDEAVTAFRAGDLQGGLVRLVDGIIAVTPHAPVSGLGPVRVNIIVGTVVVAALLIAAQLWSNRSKRRASQPPTP